MTMYGAPPSSSPTSSTRATCSPRMVAAARASRVKRARALRAGLRLRQQHLDGHPLRELLVHRRDHDAHPPAPEHPLDAVLVRDELPDRDRRGRRRGGHLAPRRLHGGAGARKVTPVAVVPCERDGSPARSRGRAFSLGRAARRRRCDPAPGRTGRGRAAAPPAARTRPASLAESLPADARRDYDAGKLLFEDGDYATALLKYQAAYDRDPRRAPALERRGVPEGPAALREGGRDAGALSGGRGRPALAGGPARRAGARARDRALHRARPWSRSPRRARRSGSTTRWSGCSPLQGRWRSTWARAGCAWRRTAFASSRGSSRSAGARPRPSR